MKEFILNVLPKGYPAYCTDEDAFYVAIGMHKLDFSLKSQFPAWVVTKAKTHAVRSVWHLYLAMHVLNPVLQQQILEQPTAKDAERLLAKNQNEIRPDIKEVKGELQKWVMCLHLAMKYRNMDFEFRRYKDKDIVYLVNPNSKSKISSYGCTQDPLYAYGTEIKFNGDNQYGRSVKRLIAAFNENPKKFLTVAPPNIPDAKLLGSAVGTYKRQLALSDDDNKPKDKQIIKQKFGSKSKAESYLES